MFGASISSLSPLKYLSSLSPAVSGSQLDRSQLTLIPLLNRCLTFVCTNQDHGEYLQVCRNSAILLWEPVFSDEFLVLLEGTESRSFEFLKK